MTESLTPAPGVVALPEGASEATSETTNGATITPHHISFSYGTTEIIHDVSLEIGSGCVVGLLGPNGTGKSTLLGVLSGDLQPSVGQVSLLGRPIDSYDRRKLARCRSVMPQAHEFPFSYLVRDIVAMGRSCYKTDRCRDDDLVDLAMARTEVAHLKSRDVTTLSGGEKARVTLARVIAQDAEIVLLDEPTAALDIAHQQQTMRLCRDMANEGKTVVAVMHDIQLAAASCDIVALMSAGCVKAMGRSHDVLTSELLSDIYGWAIAVDYLADGTLVIVPR